jgi:hypothetical protein
MKRTHLWLFLGAWLAVQGFVLAARGQTQIAKLTGSDSGPWDLFGDKVSVSGDTAAVGAPWHMNLRGAVYVFRRDVGGADHWGQVCKLLAPDGVALDNLGRAVCLDGDTLIAGAYGYPGGSDNGAAYIFQRTAPDSWVFVHKLTALDGAPDDLFGFAVALCGDTALVGAYTKNLVGIRSGATYVFERNFGGPDQWGQVKELQPEDAAAYVYFGVAIGLSGDTAIIGAYWQTDLPGRAYIFERDAGGPDNWGQTAEFFAHGLESFGYAVSIDTDTALVGAYANGDAGPGSGRAYVFQRDQGGPGVWGEAASLAAQDAGPFKNLGWSVAMGGSTALVGAPGRSVARGGAYVFRPVGPSRDTWEQVSLLLAADSAPNDLFGYSVSLSGHIAVVGAQQDDDHGDGSGSAYVFYLPAMELTGDLNCDEAVDFGDINPFVLILTNPDAWQAAYPGCPLLNGDINGDGTVDFGDINPFVALLAGP